MKDFKDKFGNIIKFADKQWNHIIKEHPEVEPYKNRILDILKEPDLVKRSKRDEDTFLYYRFYKDVYKGKYLLVIARTRDRLLLTCYITDRVKEGDLIWKKA
ncbi:hypothetical protein HYX05_00430 [Candidatus Woesearchaeota archaeon]|nr:hypothetical protein [Candidatus Woesearchaeota archaeon]